MNMGRPLRHFVILTALLCAPLQSSEKMLIKCSFDRGIEKFNSTDMEMSVSTGEVNSGEGCLQLRVKNMKTMQAFFSPRLAVNPGHQKIRMSFFAKSPTFTGAIMPMFNFRDENNKVISGVREKAGELSGEWKEYSCEREIPAAATVCVLIFLFDNVEKDTLIFLDDLAAVTE